MSTPDSNTFDLFSAIEESYAPTDFTVVHTDGQALYDYNYYESAIASIADSQSPALEELNAKSEEAAKRIEESAMEVHMRAVPKDRRDEIMEEIKVEMGLEDAESYMEMTPATRDKFLLDSDKRILAESITKIVRVRDGAVDTDITEAKIASLRKLPQDYWQQIVSLYSQLMLETLSYSQKATDPNFS